MPFPKDLLEQARHLANREPKRPKQASLRRAVSTAYYALFHLLSMETAKNWKRSAERFTVARMLDHTPMVKVCTARRDELNEYFKTRPTPVRQHSRVGVKLKTNTRRRTFLSRSCSKNGRISNSDRPAWWKSDRALSGVVASGYFATSDPSPFGGF